MKKVIKYLSILAISAVAATSCSDYLEVDRYFNDRMTLENVFTNQDYAEQWLADTYSHLRGSNTEVCGKYNSPHNFADDQTFGDGHRTDHYGYVTSGKWEDVDYASNVWSECYNGIRKATIFMQNVHMLIADSRYVTEEDVKDYHAQARFVRAYYYWLLLKKYGPVPVLGDDILDYNESYDDLARARNTFDEVVDFIASEMVIAAEDLPLTRGVLEAQRPTRGAALATRAKALIYAASPWNNPKEGAGDSYQFEDLANFDGKLLMAQEYNDEKWAKAAAACKDVMDLGVYQLHVVAPRSVAAEGFPVTVEPYDDGDFSENKWPEGYADIDPYESYRSLFNGSVTVDGNTEIIFGRGPAANQGENIKNQMVQHQMPQSIGGWNVHGMTLKQLDAYYMVDGTDAPGNDTFDEEAAAKRVKGYTTAAGEYPHLDAAGISLQFANREPRFYASVAYSGTKWPALSYSGNHVQMRNQICHYYRGTRDGYLNGKLWLRTGIGSIKFYHPEDANNGDNAVIRDKVEPAIRYADILMLYAEALNEVQESYSIPSWDGSFEHDIYRDVNEIKKGIRPVRCRAGVPDYDDETYASVEALRAKIKRERQIEFFAESQRWWDLRRWKDATEELNKPVYGYSVMMTEAQKDKFYVPTEVPQYAQVFTNKMYFWPISKTELKRNPLLTQNPGWQTFD
jgi:hypothetical protein